MSAVEVVPGQFTVSQNDWDLLPRPSRPPTVSVIVPFYEQQDDLERLLVGIELQRGFVDVREVIVVDDGSADGPVVPDWYRGPHVIVLRQADNGFRAGAARNLGASRATSNVLLFLDADMVPSPDYVARMAEIPAVAPEAMVVGSRQHWDLEGWTAPQVRSWLEGGRRPARLKDPAWLAEGYARTRHLLDLSERSYQWMISAVLAMSHRFFEELGGFDETICSYGGEDWDLAYRAQNAGALMVHCSAVAHHNGPDWSEREGPEATKNVERRNLAARIPGRRDAIIGRYALTVVRIDASDMDPDAVTLGVASALSAEPTNIAFLVEGLAIDASALLAHDSRVHLGSLRPGMADRAMVSIQVLSPVRFGPTTFERLLDLLAPGGPGRLIVMNDDEELLTCVTTRASRRVARWAPTRDPDFLWAQIFGEPKRCAAASIDVTPVVGPADLSETFRR